MAACKSLQHIFEKPLPENPTLMETLSSWNQMKPIKPPEQPSFTEIFGELHFKENSELLSSSSSSLSSLYPGASSSPSSLSSTSSTTSSFIDFDRRPRIESYPCGKEASKGVLNLYASHHKNCDIFSGMKSDSLQLCTEGLGFESCDDVEDVQNGIKDDWDKQEERVTRHSPRENSYTELRRSRTPGSAFPPPISCIGRSGKPWVCFKSYRHDGRFVLKEIRIPNQELLQACREDGRLKLQFVQPDEALEEDEEQDVEDTDNEDEYNDNVKDQDDENVENEAVIIHGESRSNSCQGNCK